MASGDFLPVPARAASVWHCWDFQAGRGFMRTNNLLASTALTTSAVLASGAAFAQPVTYNWTGWYIGLNAGGSSTQIDHNVAIPAVTGFPARFFAFDGRDGSFTGGFQAGYNWQFAPNWLIGIEGDINYLRGANATTTSAYTFNSSEDVVGTAEHEIALAFYCARAVGLHMGQYDWSTRPAAWAIGGVKIQCRRNANSMPGSSKRHSPAPIPRPAPVGPLAAVSSMPSPTGFRSGSSIFTSISAASTYDRHSGVGRCTSTSVPNTWSGQWSNLRRHRAGRRDARVP